MDKTVAELKKLATSGEGRPQPNPVQGQSRSNTTEAPGSFYGGSIGKLRDVNAPAFINKQGLPSTGREEAILGCTAAAQYAKDPSSIEPSRHIFNEFSLSNRVGVVTGAAGGLGLEMALGLVEAGATIYCVDLAPEETDTFKEARDYAAAFGGKMFYLNGNVVSKFSIKSKPRKFLRSLNKHPVHRPISKKCAPFSKRLSRGKTASMCVLLRLAFSAPARSSTQTSTSSPRS